MLPLWEVMLTDILNCMKFDLESTVDRQEKGEIEYRILLVIRRLNYGVYKQLALLGCSIGSICRTHGHLRENRP